jgi:hypothetical protein
MEDLSSLGSYPGDSPARSVSGAWSRWWVRILLFVGHLALLAAALSLTPDHHSVRLGATTGVVIFPGMVFLWGLLWFARTRGLALLFCSLVLAQAGIIALVAMHFRASARLLQEIQA